MLVWNSLDALRSRGSTSAKAGSLGALHAKREETLSQFFTPFWVVAFVWESIKGYFREEHYYSLLDNSVGAASMFRFARKDQFSINGFDIDEALVNEVSRLLDDAGYDVNITCASLDAVDLGHFTAALINPPFSIQLDSPFLTPYPGVTHYGKNGPDTSALSHEYALAQALAHCEVVAALVPRSTTEKLAEFGDLEARLLAVYQLPNDTFRSENVQAVATDVLVFGPEDRPAARSVLRVAITPETPPVPVPGLEPAAVYKYSKAYISPIGLDESEPVVTLPVTGDNRVILEPDGRQIALTFFDGATEAKVYNTLFERRIYSSKGQRLPRETKYAGQYILNLDVLLMQDNPQHALLRLTDKIASAGGSPVLTSQLRARIAELQEEYRRMSVPYGRWAYRKGTPTFRATAVKTSLVNRHQKGAVVAMGEEVLATRTNAGFEVIAKRGTFEVSHDSFFDVFAPEAAAQDASYWEEVHPPIRASYPDDIAALEDRARELGLHEWLTWDFQLEDLLELAFRPLGGVCGWQMALGKTRLALALAMLKPGLSLIIVKSRLIDELERELVNLGVEDSAYKVISDAESATDLRKINIISYERLRAPLTHTRDTLAVRLSGRLANVIADEGGLLANVDSQQTQAVWALGTRSNYIFDGTPCPNYPREMMPLAAWVAGEGRGYQPYSINGPHIYPELIDTADDQQTGRQAFLDRFVQFEWATNEFLDSGKGAKREVPRIKTENLGEFRTWIAPLIKRRVQQEPAVQKHVRFPVPTLHDPISIDWDIEHLLIYIAAVEDFASWYREYVKSQRLNEKGLNLTMILARLEACFKAANVPAKVSGFAKPFTATTRKEQACVELVIDEIDKGRRPIVFARNPFVLRRLAAQLTAAGVSSLVFTGDETIEARIKKLNSQIREGDTQVLLASLGVTQDGLNLPELNTFIFYNRSYKAREEFQAIYRLIRAKQTSDVYGYFLHMAGSIDEYMGQLIEWKTLASEAGLDFGEQPDDEEFTHFDAFIYRFLESIPALKERVKALRQAA